MADDARKFTKAEMIQAGYFADALAMIERDIVMAVVGRRKLPPGWDEIARHPGHSKTRVTIRLDDDVVKFFRGFGPGWQPKVNDVLRVFMHGRLARIIKGPDTTDFILRADEIDQHPSHKWGDVYEVMTEARISTEEARIAMEAKRFEMEAEAYNKAVEAAGKGEKDQQSDEAE